MLNISSGLLRGLSLKSPQGKSTRPTSQKIRQAIFNILRNYHFGEGLILDGAATADVFAGVGCLGLEALSNGAASCVFIELSAPTVQVLRQNIAIVEEKLKKQSVEGELTLVSGDVFDRYAKLPKIRVLFADAPYKVEASQKLLALEDQYSKIEQNGLLILETSEEEVVPESSKTLQRFDQKNYGDTSVHFFVKR